VLSSTYNAFRVNADGCVIQSDSDIENYGFADRWLMGMGCLDGNQWEAEVTSKELVMGVRHNGQLSKIAKHPLQMHVCLHGNKARSTGDD